MWCLCMPTIHNVEYINVMWCDGLVHSDVDRRSRWILWSLILRRHVDIVIKVIINKLWLNGSYVTLLRQPDNYLHFYLLLKIRIAIFPPSERFFSFHFSLFFCIHLVAFLQNVCVQYQDDVFGCFCSCCFQLSTNWPKMDGFFFFSSNV